MPSSANSYLILILCIVAFWGCSSSKGDLPVVKTVDLQKYIGSWYELVRLPNSFESGLTCVMANYSLKPNGDIKVVNSGHKIKDTSKVSTATGTAWVPDANEPTKLKVSFFWPFAGKYWILALDSNYKYAMVGDPSRDYLWILSRTKTLPESTIDTLLAHAQSLGFDTSKVERTAQDCM